MLLPLMFEKPVQPPFFHQALNKSEIGFSILDLIFQWRVGRRYTFFLREIIVGKHFPDNLNHRFILEDTEV